ncbi:MAG: hypothetical protein JXO22_06210 [Phycisphaerae bacterium]|nr:hypothetical protein [Phycisphaerae bacterium]
MISQLTGRVVRVTEHTAIIEAGALAWEVLVPTTARHDLTRLIDNEVRMHTLLFIDGGLAGGALVPRLVGFLTETERDFFNLLTKVKGISTRKALRAMSIPCHEIAAAIERGDERLLTSLPEIGKRTAAQIVTELREQVAPFVAPGAVPRPAAELTDAQQVALTIICQWGDRRADAQQWVTAAVEADSSLSDPEDIVRAAYRIKMKH